MGFWIFVYHKPNKGEEGERPRVGIHQLDDATDALEGRVKADGTPVKVSFNKHSNINRPNVCGKFLTDGVWWFLLLDTGIPAQSTDLTPQKVLFMSSWSMPSPRSRCSPLPATSQPTTWKRKVRPHQDGAGDVAFASSPTHPLAQPLEVFKGFR